MENKASLVWDGPLAPFLETHFNRRLVYGETENAFSVDGETLQIAGEEGGTVLHAGTEKGARILREMDTIRRIDGAITFFAETLEGLLSGGETDKASCLVKLEAVRAELPEGERSAPVRDCFAALTGWCRGERELLPRELMCLSAAARGEKRRAYPQKPDYAAYEKRACGDAEVLALPDGAKGEFEYKEGFSRPLELLYRKTFPQTERRFGVYRGDGVYFAVKEIYLHEWSTAGDGTNFETDASGWELLEAPAAFPTFEEAAAAGVMAG